MSAAAEPLAPGILRYLPDQRSKAGSPHFWLLAAACGDSAGLLLQAYTGYRGELTGYPPQIVFWVGLFLIFGVTALAVALAEFSYTEFGFVVALAGVALLLTRLALYPQLFASHDELIHVRVLADILKTHHLFTYNTILPAAPHYPGLETLTACITNLTGLSAHVSSEVVLVGARILMMLGLFSVVHRLSGSRRGAAIACLIYMADPEYLTFDSAFSYQTLALPLAFCFVSLISRLSGTDARRAYPVLALAALAVAMSHHLTSVGLFAVLFAWWVAGRVLGRRPAPHLVFAIGAVSAAIAIWGFGARNVVLPYLSAIGSASLASLEEFFGGSSGHALFTASGGQTDPPVEELALVLSVVILTLALVPALWSARRFIAQRRAAAVVATVVALVYPLTAAGHLPAGTSQVADRSTSFIYAPLGFVFASWLMIHRRSALAVSAAKRSLATVLVAGVATLVFFGGSVLGAGPPFARTPGKYVAGGGNRAMDRFTVASAEWLGRAALPNRRLYGDWVDGYISGALGDQQYLTAAGNGIDNLPVSRLVLAAPSPTDATTIHEINLQLLVVDDRNANHVAAETPYTDSGEFLPRTRTGAPTTSAIDKFKTYPGSDTIYDNGPLQIYDVRGVA
jgi:hypothetical protein